MPVEEVPDSLAVPPGVQLNCYGPFKPPDGARALRSLLPKVNMAIVHHMIMFGGTAGGKSVGGLYSGNAEGEPGLVALKAEGRLEGMLREAGALD